MHLPGSSHAIANRRGVVGGTNLIFNKLKVYSSHTRLPEYPTHGYTKRSASSIVGSLGGRSCAPPHPLVRIRRTSAIPFGGIGIGPHAHQNKTHAIFLVWLVRRLRPCRFAELGGKFHIIEANSGRTLTTKKARSLQVAGCRCCSNVAAAMYQAPRIERKSFIKEGTIAGKGGLAAG